MDFRICDVRVSNYVVPRRAFLPKQLGDARCRVVCCVPIYPGHQVFGRTSRGPREEGHTGFQIQLPSAVRALLFLARRIQPFLSLVDREVEFCVLT